MKAGLKYIAAVGGLGLFVPWPALAHCPLCTAGAGLVAIGAYWIGVNGATVGLLLGAFAFALGLWLARIIKKQYIPKQAAAIGIFSWLTTLLPLKMLLSEYTSIYLNWGGAYGSFFNRTYPVNLFLIGGAVGGVLVFIAPRVSRAVTLRRGKTAPYQGVMITLALLIVSSILTQFIL